jgi:four helix bundle protein
MRDEGGGMNGDAERNTSEPPKAVDLRESKAGQRSDLRKRLRDFAIRILRLYDSLPKHGAVHIITHQLARSGTSPGAHYREACRAKSNADFISKNKLQSLRDETNELISIFVTMARNAKSRNRR